MAVIEVRFRVRGQSDVAKALQDTKKESDAVVNSIRAAGKQVGDRLVLSLRDARKVLVDLGGDTKRFEQAIKQAGVSTRDATVLTQALTKELNASRKEVLGIAVNGRDLVKALRDGAWQAQILSNLFGKAKESLEAMKRLGKVKGLEESTKDALDLNAQFDKLQAKLRLVGDDATFAKIRKNVADASILANIPQSKLVEGIDKAQDVKSAGRELALDDNGALLKQYAKAAYGSQLDTDAVPDYISSQVILQKNLGITGAREFARIQGITVSGAEKGALEASQIATKGGGVIAQLQKLRGTNKEQAYREGQAFLQKVGDSPGIDGDINTAVNRSENYLAKLADPETRKRIKEATGIDPILSNGRLRPLPEIAKAFEIAETRGKIILPKGSESFDSGTKVDAKKKVKANDIYEIFKDMQAREGHFAVRTNYQKLIDLEKVSADEGLDIIEKGFGFRVGSKSGQLEGIGVRDQATHLEKLDSKFKAIRNTSDVVSRVQANYPVTAGLIDTVSDVAGLIGPKAKLVTEATLASGVAYAATRTSGSARRSAVLDQELQQQRQATADKAANLQTSQSTLDSLQRELAGRGVTVNLVVESGLRATVTTKRNDTKKAGRSGTRAPSKAGQN